LFKKKKLFQNLGSIRNPDVNCQVSTFQVYKGIQRLSRIWDNTQAMAKKDSNAIFYVTLVIIAVCCYCIWNFSGFSHEGAKFNMILVAFLAVSIIQIVVYTPIKYTIMSVDAACWPDHQPPVTPDKNAKVETFMDKVRLRLRSLKSELMITESHRNEKLNQQYRLIEGELVLWF